MDMAVETNIERNADKKGQKMDGNIYCPATEADRKDTVCPLRDRYFLSGSGEAFVSQARKSSLWIADLAFPDYELRREIFLAMSWREIIHSSNFAGLTTPREFAKGRNVIPHHTEGRVLRLQRSPSLLPTVTWNTRMNLVSTIFSGLAGAALGFFQSAQFQSVIRSALKAGGTWLAVKAGLHADEQVQFVGQVVGLGLMAWGFILSAVVHAGGGSSATGTAPGPNPSTNLGA